MGVGGIKAVGVGAAAPPLQANPTIVISIMKARS
jgi:hypothetical protein